MPAYWAARSKINAAAFRRGGAGEVETIMVDAGDATPR